jgi:peptidoglycan hydrolase-like protein with peptidoglycan-binding domain
MRVRKQTPNAQRRTPNTECDCLQEANKRGRASVKSRTKRMTIRIAVLILFACAGAIRADEVTAEVQQALKDQGFYYGQITGNKDADTTAAIRRYQIRNGLKITGELDNDTLKVLRSVPSTSSPPPVAKAPAATPAPPSAPREEESETAAAPPREQSLPPPPAEERYPAGPIQRSEALYPPNAPNAPNAPGAPSYPGGLFADTPYESAPPQVQRDMVVSAQRALSRRGYYHGEMDGVYASALEFSLRAYQSRVGLPVTGRLDLETLAALELLPGAKAPVYRPRRRVPPPIRGEWIRP